MGIYLSIKFVPLLSINFEQLWSVLKYSRLLVHLLHPQADFRGSCLLRRQLAERLWRHLVLDEFLTVTLY